MARSITIEDLYKFQLLSRPRISPDGQRVAFVVTTIDERRHSYQSAIWVIPTAGGEAQRFTGGTAKAHSPCWSPDGRWLAFVSDRESEPSANSGKDTQDQKQRGKGKAQVWLLPTDGGEAHQLTFMPHGASNPVWSPDSQKLLFSAAVGPFDEEGEDGKPLPKARVIDRLFYRLDGVGYIYERRQHLFLIAVAGGEPQQLTDGDWDDKEPTWSPDGTRIAFTSNRRPDRWQYTPCPDIYTLSLSDNQPGEPQCLTDGTLSCCSLSWSPDGKTLAFMASARLRSGGHVELFTIAADAPESSPRSLTSEFKGSFLDRTNTDMTDEFMSPAPPWSPDGQTLYAMAAYRGATHVFAIPVSGAGKDPQTLTPGNLHVLDFSVDSSKNHIAVLIEDPTHLAEIFIGTTTEPGKLCQITHFNDDLFSELALSTPEYMPYSGVDDWPMDGWLLHPPDFDPARKYPLIVEIHGGPNTQYGYGFMHEMHVLAAAGYVVLYTNPRGSIGYGRDFSLAVRGAWAEKDSWDIMAGVDAALQKGYIDEARLGVTGGSYGGYMTSWLVGHTDRFKAAVADRSVTNRHSFFGTSDIGVEFTDDDLEVTPWDDPQSYMRISPITYVKNIHTPLLIIHSESDLRCGIEQSEQLFTALKYMRREVLFVRFEGQSHGLSRGGHPKLRVERLRHIREWFERYL